MNARGTFLAPCVVYSACSLHMYSVNEADVGDEEGFGTL